MTQSRTRPDMKQINSGKTLTKDLPKGHNEILDNSIDILITTTEIETIKEKCSIMSHKLHTVLTELLRSKKLSARKAAKECGVPLSTFTGYLKPNKHQIDPNHLMALGRYFGVSVDYLLTGQEQSTRLHSLPTKKIFSRWVKLTIEEIADDSDIKIKLEEK